MKTDDLSALPAAIESYDVARRVTVATRPLQFCTILAARALLTFQHEHLGPSFTLICGESWRGNISMERISLHLFLCVHQIRRDSQSEHLFSSWWATSASTCLITLKFLGLLRQDSSHFNKYVSLDLNVLDFDKTHFFRCFCFLLELHFWWFRD